uniref:Uncharacterized protein n=2 Tax=Clastoptera arizonana TaxID=38151 RepID=A0A1B6E8V2_9HEMI
MDTYFLIAEAKKKLTTELEVPEPVLHAIKFLIERSIWISLAKKMEQILYSITHTILYVLDRIKNSDDKTSYRKQSKIKPPPTFMCLSPEAAKVIKFGKVSFGEQLKVPRNEKKIDWKSIKTRRPTPVGSILTIANAALSDAIAEKETPNIEFLEQSKVLKFIDRIGKWLLNEVEGRVRELTLEIITKETHIERTNRISFPYPWIRLCKLVLYSEKDDFISILDAIVMDVISDIQFRESFKVTEKNKIKK